MIPIDVKQIDTNHPLILSVRETDQGIMVMSITTGKEAKLSNLFFNILASLNSGKTVPKLHLVVIDHQIIPVLLDSFYNFPGINQVAVIRSETPKVIGEARAQSLQRRLGVRVRKTLPKQCQRT